MLVEKEVRLDRASRRLFRVQARAAAAAYEDRGSVGAIEAARNFDGRWFRLLTAHYAVTGKAFGRYTAEQIGDAQATRTFEQILGDFISREALRKSNLINQTTIEIIQDVILGGVADQLGPREIARNIRKTVADDQGIARSDMIARTETHNAATFSGQATAEASGLDFEREWVASIDGRERPEHAAADGQKVGMQQDFFVGGENVSRPGEGSASNAINCRCSIIYDPRR